MHIYAHFFNFYPRFMPKRNIFRAQIFHFVKKCMTCKSYVKTQDPYI